MGFTSGIRAHNVIARRLSHYILRGGLINVVFPPLSLIPLCYSPPSTYSSALSTCEIACAYTITSTNSRGTGDGLTPGSFPTKSRSQYALLVCDRMPAKLLYIQNENKSVLGPFSSCTRLINSRSIFLPPEHMHANVAATLLGNPTLDRTVVHRLYASLVVGLAHLGNQGGVRRLCASVTDYTTWSSNAGGATSATSRS